MKYLLLVGSVLLVTLSGCLSEEEIRAITEKQKAERESRQKAAVAAAAEQSKNNLDQYWDILAERNFGSVRENFAALSKKHVDVNEEPKWISRWVGHRLNLTPEEAQKGEQLLEQFGTNYMPNAYARYVEAKKSALDVQAVFNENFKRPWSIKPTDGNWNAYCKVLNRLSKSRMKFLRCHDELCHYYLLSKVGAKSNVELAKIDRSEIKVWLLEQGYGAFYVAPNFKLANEGFPKLDSKLQTKRHSEFVSKLMPETYAAYKDMKAQYDDALKLCDGALKRARVIDAVRYELSVMACFEKVRYIEEVAKKTLGVIESEHLSHKIAEKDAATVAADDRKLAAWCRAFCSLLPDYVQKRTNGPLIYNDPRMSQYVDSTIVLQWHMSALGFTPMNPMNQLDVVWAYKPEFERDGNLLLWLGSGLDMQNNLKTFSPQHISVLKGQEKVGCKLFDVTNFAGLFNTGLDAKAERAGVSAANGRISVDLLAVMSHLAYRKAGRDMELPFERRLNEYHPMETPQRIEDVKGEYGGGRGQVAWRLVVR